MTMVMLYVYPWQGWVLDLGPLACVGAMFAIAAIVRLRYGESIRFTGPRWLPWLYLAGLATCLFYVFHRFP